MKILGATISIRVRQRKPLSIVTIPLGVTIPDLILHHSWGGPSFLDVTIETTNGPFGLNAMIPEVYRPELLTGVDFGIMAKAEGDAWDSLLQQIEAERYKIDFV